MLRAARRIRRRYTDVPFAVIIGFLGVNTAITFFLRPNVQAAALLASPLDYAWVATYGIGGVLILAGIGTGLANLEAAGCVAFGTAAVVSGVATVAVRGLSTWNALAVLAVFAGGAAVRAFHLFRGRVLVLLDQSTVRSRNRSP